MRRPNIVILTIGRSGSTLLVQELIRRGWAANDCDAEYGESVSFRAVNQRELYWRRRGRRASQVTHLSQLIAGLREPWVLKDPRLSLTYDLWRPCLNRDDNLLIYLTRSLDEIEECLRRRQWGEEDRYGRWKIHGRLLHDLPVACDRAFQQWAGPKIQIDHRELGAICRDFRQPQSVSGEQLHGNGEIHAPELESQLYGKP
jgi:hypothetical protein